MSTEQDEVVAAGELANKLTYAVSEIKYREILAIQDGGYGKEITALMVAAKTLNSFIAFVSTEEQDNGKR